MSKKVEEWICASCEIACTPFAVCEVCDQRCCLDCAEDHEQVCWPTQDFWTRVPEEGAQP